MYGGIVENVVDAKAVYDASFLNNLASAEDILKSLFFQKSLGQVGDDPFDAIADQNQLGQRSLVPIRPQQIVCQMFRTVREEEDGSLVDFVLPFHVVALDDEVQVSQNLLFGF